MKLKSTEQFRKDHPVRKSVVTKGGFAGLMQIIHYQQTPEFWEGKAKENWRQAKLLKAHLEERDLPTDGSGLDYWTRRAQHCAAEAIRLRQQTGANLNVKA